MDSKQNDWKVVSSKKKRQTKQLHLFRTSWHEDKVHYIPKNIKIEIDSIMNKCMNTREMFDKLKINFNSNSKLWTSIVVYIIHESSNKDRLEVLEYIFKKTQDASKLANSKCGPKEYTPIFKSAFKGSIRALKILICAGAKINTTNIEGESVLEALEAGNIYANEKDPDYIVFNDSRFDECRNFLLNHESRNNNEEDEKIILQYSSVNDLFELLMKANDHDDDTIINQITDDPNIDIIQETFKSEDFIDFLKYDASPIFKEKIENLFIN